MAQSRKSNYAYRVKFSEIAARMTGFSSPVFGVSWQPPTPDVTVARSMISFLEDRRVLYEKYAFESPEWCIESIMKIREFLTDVLTGQAIGSHLTASVKAMRAACRKFIRAMDQRLDTLGPSDATAAQWKKYI